MTSRFHYNRVSPCYSLDMLTLFLSLVLLGLAAVDPVGVAAMPVLLTQKEPYRRCLLFLGGSFASLVVMGVVFAKGFGAALLRYEQAVTWLVTAVETGAGVVLLATGLYLFWRLHKGKRSAESSKSTAKKLELNDSKLFAFGALLVLVQSVVDVVFIVAMVRIGQMRISDIQLGAAVATYAIAALALQLVVVLAYWLSPRAKRLQVLQKVQSYLECYADKAIILVCILLGLILLAMAQNT